MNKNNTEVPSSPKSYSYHYIFKIILIGDANTGKTSLINRYITNSFMDRYICTVGVDFMMKTITYDGQTIKLQIWDTAGMERYKQITTSYYRGAQAAIICFDLTSKESFKSMNKWIDEFSLHYNPIFQKFIVIVGNKADLIDKRAVSLEEIEEFVKMNNYLYFESSAKTGEKVDELFQTIAQMLYKNYKNNVNSQVTNAIQMKKSTTLNNVENFKNLIENKNQKRCNC
jgi:small GTP-binding protein